ncbi:unnamed protein product [Taenia asiatica]|uniref:Ubiquitin thioesterase OTU n=1 Tax=Taenia asiatica TaxID=60517 RepID=A0A0R3VSI4_TAEAS|nr:unnamed protein product [Taenia asiatica]
MVDQALQTVPPVCRNVPLVARKAACFWPAVMNWSPDYLAEVIKENLSFRIGHRDANDLLPQWECDAHYVSTSVTDFVSWCRGNNTVAFGDYQRNDWWAYAAYLHMRTTSALSSLQKDVPWNSIFPYLPNCNGSTFWLGTDQSHTGCHYDTYGVNFVLQVFGKKRWILFPPSDTPFLYPTRLPLEESTVFSRINFRCPNFIKYPLILSAHPRVVTLQSGDLLFVPRQWWHFVETVEEDISCAVNLWIDQPQLDNTARCKEALTQLACFSLAKCAPDGSGIINRLHAAEKIFAKSEDWFDSLVECISTQMSCLSPKSSSPTQITGGPVLDWSVLSATDIVDILPDSDKLPLPSGSSEMNVEKIIAAFLHPDTDVSNRPDSTETNAENRVVLRCKSEKGQSVLVLTGASTLEDLVAEVVASTGISREVLILRSGYPPKRINLSPENCQLTLSELKICSGDSIMADARPLESPSTGSRKAPSSRLIRKVAPSDDCCLFTSVNFCVSNRDSSWLIGEPIVTNAEAVQETRTLIAHIVLSDPVTFNEAILGMPSEDYAKFILEPHRWGGGIEVSILSMLYEVEIDVVDVLTSRIDRFGEDKAYSHRILLLYDGIHYDALAVELPDFGTLQTIFPTTQNSVLVEAQSLAREVKLAGQFTDLTNCNLMCTVCRTPLRGQQGAQQHAKSTGHARFQERTPF